MENFDVVALGELLIDFTENGLSNQGNVIFEANPGGAPCNVLAMLQKLGHRTAFIGKVGDDLFGQQLQKAVDGAGICTDYLLTDNHVKTTLAFVKKRENGDRDFSFYRDPGADMMLTETEVPQKVIENSRIFHFGTLSMTHEGVRNATCRAIEYAEANDVLISFDPNLRPPLWGNLEDAKIQIAYGLSKCNILKISDEELLFVTGESNFDKGSDILRTKYPNISLLNVTAGANGSYSYYQDNRVFQPAFCMGNTIETTGAGDTFCACVLDFVLRHGLEQISATDLAEMLRFANAAAYLVTTRKGALLSMPEVEQIEQLLECQ